MDIKTEKRDNVLIFALSGMLDASNYQSLDDQVQNAINDGAQYLVFNLQHLEYLSSAGIRVFIKAYRSLKSKGGSMAFSSLQPFVLEIFEIAGITSSLQIFPDDEEACISFLHG